MSGDESNMSVLGGKELFDTGFIDGVRTRVLEAIAFDKITRRQFADEIGIPEGTVGPWLNDKYAGDKIKVAQAGERWLVARADKARQARVRIPKPGFQMTPTADMILRTLDDAQFNGRMVLVPLKPGSGKSQACIHQARSRNRVYLATMRPSTAGVAGSLLAVLEAMGEPEAKGAPNVLARRICGKVKEPGALIIIDEAQNLSVPAVEELRAIWDDTQCGMAFVGDERLLATFDASQFAQLRRRIGRRCPPVKKLDGDVAVLAAAWQVTDSKEVAFLQQVARKPGALGGVTEVLDKASQLAALEETSRNLGHMRAAWDELMPEVAL